MKPFLLPPYCLTTERLLLMIRKEAASRVYDTASRLMFQKGFPFAGQTPLDSLHNQGTTTFLTVPSEYFIRLTVPGCGASSCSPVSE